MLSIKKYVPNEILSLLEKGGYSLHIKGSAGTGKTTLALEIAKSMSSKGSVIYLSTRVSPERVINQFPWVREFLEENNILDAKLGQISPDVPKDVLFEYTEQPEFLKLINAKIQMSEKRPVTVIVDSLDALKAHLNISEANLTLESNLLELGEKTSTNMLFVTENSSESKLDYLTDEVVRLEREVLNKRLVRKIYLEKIRGEKIHQPYYLFTLKDSRFTTFKPEMFPRIKHVIDITELKKRKNLIPTSIKELDRILYGGLRKGTLNLFEEASVMGTEYVYLTNPITSSFIQQGYPVFVIAAQSASTKLSIDYVMSLMGIKEKDNLFSEFQKYIYLFQFKESAQKNTWKEISVSKESIEKFIEVFKKSVIEITTKLGVETFLWFLGVDTMERIYGEEAFRKAIGTLVFEMSTLNGICIAIAMHGIKSMETLTHLASTHFIIDDIGAPIVYGVFPKTGIYAIAAETTNGMQKVDLIEIE
ncbi:MAG: gas vesicle protein GvpD P-loop domain-containing protein [Candidatus Jordarchaeaceae archaeon]